MEKIRPKKAFFLHMYAYLTSEDKKILHVKKEGGGPHHIFFPGPTAAVAGPACEIVNTSRGKHSKVQNHKNKRRKAQKSTRNTERTICISEYLVAGDFTQITIYL